MSQLIKLTDLNGVTIWVDANRVAKIWNPGFADAGAEVTLGDPPEKLWVKESVEHIVNETRS